MNLDEKIKQANIDLHEDLIQIQLSKIIYILSNIKNETEERFIQEFNLNGHSMKASQLHMKNTISYKNKETKKDLFKKDSELMIYKTDEPLVMVTNSILYKNNQYNFVIYEPLENDTSGSMLSYLINNFESTAHRIKEYTRKLLLENFSFMLKKNVPFYIFDIEDDKAFLPLLNDFVENKVIIEKYTLKYTYRPFLVFNIKGLTTPIEIEYNQNIDLTIQLKQKLFSLFIYNLKDNLDIIKQEVMNSDYIKYKDFVNLSLSNDFEVKYNEDKLEGEKYILSIPIQAPLKDIRYKIKKIISMNKFYRESKKSFINVLKRNEIFHNKDLKNKMVILFDDISKNISFLNKNAKLYMKDVPDDKLFGVIIASKLIKIKDMLLIKDIIKNKEEIKDLLKDSNVFYDYFILIDDTIYVKNVFTKNERKYLSSLSTIKYNNGYDYIKLV